MRAAAAFLLGAMLLAGCGSRDTSVHAPQTTAAPATTVAAPTTTAQPPVTLTIYPVRDGAVHPEAVRAPATRAVAAASLRALGLDGATVSIAGGTASVEGVDVSPAQAAAVVYTLTQFPSVQRVDVGGRTGLTRDDVAAFAPLILVEQPAAGASVPAEVRVRGTAVVYEGTLVVELVRGGAVLDRRTVTASAGAPERGTFETTLHAPSAGAATLVAYAPSAEDGSHQHEVDVPVTVTS